MIAQFSTSALGRPSSGLRAGSHVAALVVAALLPVMLFASAMVYVFAARERSALEQRLADSAAQISAEIDAELDNEIRELEILAATSLVDPDHPERLRGEAERLVRSDKLWGDVLLVDARGGRVLLDLAYTPGAPLPSLADRRPLAEVLARSRPVIAVASAPGSVPPEPAVSVWVPVVRAGRVGEVLASVMRPMALSRMLIRRNMPERWTVAVLDASKVVIGRNRSPADFVGRLATPSLAQAIERSATGLFIAQNQEGASVYSVFRRSGQTGWTVALGIPVDEVAQPLRHTLLLIALGGATALVLAAALATLIGRDLVRRRRVSEQLRETEAILGAYFEHTLDGMSVIRAGPDGGFTVESYNEALAATTGIPAAAAAGRPVGEVFPPERAPALLRHLAECLARGKPAEYEETIVEGTRERYWQTMLVPLREADGATRRIIGTAREITEAHRLEAALRQAQKMEAVGQMTGGVAHDFNNLLTVILGNLDLAKEETRSEYIARFLATATKAAQRGATLTQQLLAFARRQFLQPELVDANRLIGDFHQLMQQAAGQASEVRFDFAAGLGRCRVDRVQFEAAILNLVVNARDATPQGGSITIATREIVIGEMARDAPAELKPGRYILVSVTDTGEGIAPEILDRVFEPFFTTKEVGQGSGLGLSMVYGFVKQSGGTVVIQSTLRRGTTVSIYLPSIASAAEVAALGPEPEVRGGSETVLLVEDNEDVLELTRRLLVELGYRVLVARDGRAALDLLRRDRGIDILLSDVVMPGGLSGDRLAGEAQILRPGLKVLLTTGHTTQPAAHYPMLAKPYRRAELAISLRRVLGEPVTS